MKFIIEFNVEKNIILFVNYSKKIIIIHKNKIIIAILYKNL